MKNEFLGDMSEVLPKLRAGAVDMIFADLPYNTTKAKWDTSVDLDIFWKECWRVLKPNGVVICTAQVPFNIILGYSQLKYLKYEWIWEKTSATGGMNAKKMPMKAHENIMVFYKNLPTYNPQKTFGHIRKISSKSSRSDCIKRVNQKEDYIYGKQYEDKITGYDSTERYPRSVVEFSSDKQKLSIHPTQKPLELLKYLIKTYTNEGDTVLDPCRGSNTTGVACDNLKRGYIGIEKDKHFYKIGILRREHPNFRTKELCNLMK